MDKEQVWKSKRLGCISASELNDLFSRSGKVTEANMDYVRKKRFHRKHKFELPVTGRALEIGREMEHDAVEWVRANYPSLDLVYAQECEEIPFWRVDWANYGASPDCYTSDERIVVEIKNLVGNDNVYFFGDDYTTYEEKRAEVFKEHGNQIGGQFLSNDKVEEIWLVKYIYQRDDVMEDVDSPVEPWRGIVFKFKREDFDLEAMKERIILFDKFIDSKDSPSMLKEILKKGGQIMELNEYQKKAMGTCLPSCENFSYMMLNLVGEVGEFTGKVAKAIRKDFATIEANDLFDIPNDTTTDLKSEAGDILWQLAGLCKVMGWDLNDVAQCNLDKLANRKKEGTIITHQDH